MDGYDPDVDFGLDGFDDQEAEAYFNQDDAQDVNALLYGFSEGEGVFDANATSRGPPLSDDGAGVGEVDDMEVPEPIEDVRLHLPNVHAANAFPVVVSVVSQAELGVGVDLRDLSSATRNVEFMPNERIAAATMRLHDPSATILVRTSGSLTIVGAASIGESRQAAEVAARLIRKALRLEFEAIRFRVRSLMARFNMCSPVRLEALACHRLGEPGDPLSKGLSGVFCSYEPDRFMGCIVRLVGKSKKSQWSVSCTVFVTGKVNMMGARSMDELKFAFDALVPIVSLYIPKPSGAAVAAL